MMKRELHALTPTVATTPSSVVDAPRPPTADVTAYSGLSPERLCARWQGQVGGKELPDVPHERLRHVRVRRRLACADARRAEPRRPTGAKYMEFVTNAMPSFFTCLPFGLQRLKNGELARG